jgi:hypothetical protein
MPIALMEGLVDLDMRSGTAVQRATLERRQQIVVFRRGIQGSGRRWLRCVDNGLDDFARLGELSKDPE